MEVYPIQSPTGVPLYPVNKHTGHYLKTPIYILSVFVASLKQYFSSNNRISVETSLYLWDPDQSKSNIWISEEYSFDRSVIGKRPAVLIGFESQTYPQQAMGDFFSHDIANSTSYLFNMVEGALRFRCISENMLSSLELATEVRYFLSAFRHEIEKAFCLDKIRPMALSKTIKIEEYKEYWVTDFNCELKYQETWGVTTENLRVKSVFTNLQIDENSAKKLLPQQQIR